MKRSERRGARQTPDARDARNLRPTPERPPAFSKSLRSRPMRLAQRRKRARWDNLYRYIRTMLVAACLLWSLWLIPASAPIDHNGIPPTAAERFEDWKEQYNRSTIQVLPGNTPQPGSQLAMAQRIESAAEALLEPEEPPQGQAPAAAETPAPVQGQYPQYAPGSLHHESDTLQVDIEQHIDGDITYYVADVVIKDPAQFGYAFSYDKFKATREHVSDIADRHGAVLAINGDFCGFHTEGIIIRGFELYRKQNSSRHLMIVDQNGDLSVLTDRREKQGVVASQLMAQGVMHTFEFGPVLVRNGEAVDLPNKFFIRTSKEYIEPRTAIGQVGPLHYIIIVVDGRQEGYSVGVSLPELQALFLRHGAEFAFNLDGGGSTTLYFKGQVINHPSSGEERSVSDIIQFVD